jgi:PAS domain S-box-containing protein
MFRKSHEAKIQEPEHKREPGLIRNKSLFAILTVVFISFGLATTYFVSDYFKRAALNNLAESNAEQTSALIFEIMYTKMQDGWNKAEIERIISRINGMNNGMKVGVYRSTLVEQMYGAVEEDNKKIANDPALQRAMKGEVQFLPNKEDNSVRYIYPLTVQQDCLRCHANAKIGDVNGVIDVYLPANNIQIPLANIMRYFIIFTVVAIIFTLALFHFFVDRIFISPITKFTDSIDAIEVNDVFNKYIKCNSKTYEVHTLELAFNRLLSKINRLLSKNNHIMADLRNKNKLLEEHKSAIDASTIVSKTDLNGIITYVNTQFCLISGYKADELIGKNHNIVRSPNMPKEAFEDLWKSIKNKKTWAGIVENRKKNGESYFVNAVVMPILNENNEIVEFIGMRQDITELKKLQLDELGSSVERALEIHSDEMVKLVALPCACVDEASAVISSNDRFSELFGEHDFAVEKLDDLFINKTGYVCKDEILDWKDMVIDLQDEVAQKVLIDVDDKPQEFFIALSKIADKNHYLVFLTPSHCEAANR